MCEIFDALLRQHHGLIDCQSIPWKFKIFHNSHVPYGQMDSTR